MRPALAALASQQKEIDALKGVVAFVVDAAGLTGHPHITALMKQAADENPAQGVGWAVTSPEAPGSEAPAATTQEALTPSQGTDDPEAVGATPGTDVSADATTSLDSTDTVLDVPLDLNEQDVTKPVAGTDDLGEGARGNAGSGRTETEVRVGEPSDTGAAFTETGWTTSSKAPSEGRQIAAMRLARLRMEAGIEPQQDDLTLGATIASSDMADEAIQTEIDTLAKVKVASAQRQTTAAPRHLVPRSAGVQRTTPSMAQEPVQPIQTVASGPHDDEFAFE